MKSETNALDIDAFHIYASTIKNQYNEMHEARKTHIKAMYRILRANGYTRIAAVETIYKTLSDKLNSLIEVRKTYIEDLTKGIK